MRVRYALFLGFSASAFTLLGCSAAKHRPRYPLIRIHPRSTEVRLQGRKDHPSLVLKGGGTGQIHSAAFSPDGRMLASGFREGVVSMWDLRTGRSKWTRSPG